MDRVGRSLGGLTRQPALQLQEFTYQKRSCTFASGYGCVAVVSKLCATAPPFEKNFNLGATSLYTYFPERTGKIQIIIFCVGKILGIVCTKDVERDVYGMQKKVWRMPGNRKSDINETIKTNIISNEKWEEHVGDLYEQNHKEEPNQILRMTKSCNKL